MTWLPDAAPGDTPLARVFGLRPEAWARFRELDAQLWTGPLDPATLELCRLRIATLLRAETEARERRPGALSGAQAAELARWPTSPLFTAAQRACLAFAEQYVLDPHGVTDADFAALRAHLAPPAVAALVLACAVFDARARFAVALGA